MQRNRAPFALRTRIRQAIVLLILLLPLYTYIGIQSPTCPTIHANKNNLSDTITTDTIPTTAPLIPH